MSNLTPAVQAWIQKAENDLKTIRASLASADPTWDTVCFHAQQAAEKYLKAYLVALMNSPVALEHRAQVEAFQRKQRTDLVTLVFTDLVDSVAFRRQLGDQAGTSLLQAHRQLVRQTLAGKFHKLFDALLPVSH